MKRGRKPKEKNYFREKEEQAVVNYINAGSEDDRNAIFNTILQPALTKMIESIIRRYKLFVPDEEFYQNFNDTISYLLTKISHYKPVINEYEEIPVEEAAGKTFTILTDAELHDLEKNGATDADPEYIKVIFTDMETGETTEKNYKKVKKRYKAYSYCGTVCRNYLMYKCSQYSKKRKRNMSYDTMFEELNNNSKYSTEEDEHFGISEKVLVKVSDGIEKMIENAEEYHLDEEEVTVGMALVNLFRNWDKVLPEGSNKLQKSTILYFLREETMMTTKEIRDNMKKYYELYFQLKKKELEE